MNLKHSLAIATVSLSFVAANAQNGASASYNKSTDTATTRYNGGVSTSGNTGVDKLKRSAPPPPCVFNGE